MCLNNFIWSCTLFTEKNRLLTNNIHALIRWKSNWENSLRGGSYEKKVCLSRVKRIFYTCKLSCWRNLDLVALGVEKNRFCKIFNFRVQKIQNPWLDTNHDDNLYTNMRVAWFIIEQTLFQKRVCESLDECYLYFLNNHLISPHLLYSHCIPNDRNLLGIFSEIETADALFLLQGVPKVREKSYHIYFPIGSRYFNIFFIEL